MRVLLAFDKFKGSMTAREACNAAVRGIRAAHANWRVESVPLADGGDGFCEVLTQAVNGKVLHVTVQDPLSRSVPASLGLVDLAKVPPPVHKRYELPSSGTAAIVEMAAASGLAMLAKEERNPMSASSFGTGELVRAACEHNATCIFMGVGGSATNDLGFGALEALGLSFFDGDNKSILNVAPKRWPAINRLSREKLIVVPPILIACDVINPLSGENGATAVYGPQKGLEKSKSDWFENEMRRLGRLLCETFRKPEDIMNQPGAGAAGGIAFGFDAALDARRVAGFDFVAEWMNLVNAVKNADLVITGEGSFDSQSVNGKGPGRVAQMAVECGKPVMVAAGRIDTQSRHVLRERGASAVQIAAENEPVDESLRNGPQNLEQAMKEVFSDEHWSW